MSLRRRLAAVAVAALLAPAACALAQERPLEPTDIAPRSPVAEPEVVPSQPLAGAVDPREYVVGPGDVFQLRFSGRLTGATVLQVGPEGTLYVAGVGSIAVSGRTLEEARAEVLRRIASQFHGVNVDLSLARTRIMKVFLTGPATNSGPLLVPATSHVSDVLPDTLLGPKASRRDIRVVRRPQPGAPAEPDLVADLTRFRATGDRRYDPVLRDGDVLRVPVAMRFVTVEGAVGRPGRFELGEHDSLRTLLDLAGGPLPAAAPNALFVRFTSATQTESLQVAIAEVASGAFNPALRDGDQLFAFYQPRFHETARVGVVGEVARPGTYPIQIGRTRLSELIATAGGFLDRADLSAIRVYRGTGLERERDPELERLLALPRRDMTATEYAVLRTRLAARNENYRVDWRRLQSDPALDLVLEDGDIVRADPIVLSLRVDGEVRRPGLLNYVAGETVGEVVARSGGYTNRAWRGKVRVVRAVNGQTMLARNVRTLDPGDFVWVPEKPDATTWEQAKDVLGVLAQAATIVIAIRSVR